MYTMFDYFVQLLTAIIFTWVVDLIVLAYSQIIIMFTKRKHDLLIAAVEKDDVDSLVILSYAADLCTFTEHETGNTLLHIAVFKKRKNVFKYLLAIEAFPLNKPNCNNETALKLSLPDRGYTQDQDERDLHDHFAGEMLKKGASVHCGVFLRSGETLLHYTIRNGYVAASKAIVDGGCDVNARSCVGVTPLLMCFHPETPASLDLVIFLLYEGADPTVRQPGGYYSAFEYVIMSRLYDLRVAFVDYLIDDYTSIDVRFEVLLMLQMEDVRLFRIILEHTDNVIVDNTCELPFNFLQSVDTDDLEVFIKKGPDAFREVFSNAHANVDEYPDLDRTEEIIAIDVLYGAERHPVSKSDQKRFLENLNLLFQNELREDMTSFMESFSLNFMPDPDDEDFVTQYMYLLLSYGVRLNKNHLILFYDKYGFGEALRLVLETEIEQNPSIYIKDGFLEFLYNVQRSIEDTVETASQYTPQHLKRARRTDVLHYFSDLRLREAFSDDDRPHVIATIASQPTLPLLVELVRNTFREFTVEKFNITSSAQFHSLVKRLLVAPEFERILTFERKLY